MAFMRSISIDVQSTHGDMRKLSDLADTWYKLYGKSLKSGETRHSYLQNIISEIPDKIATTFTSNDYTHFRAKRLDKVSTNTANHDLVYLKSMFNQLIDAGEWKHENPLAKVKKLRDKKRPKVRCLDHAEMHLLLNELQTRESDAYLNALVCLSTGARWSEPLSLRKEDISEGYITLTETKNGNPRTLPISEDLEKQLRTAVPLKNGYKVFQRVIDELKIDLPDNQLTHVLRHTFAKSYIRNGGHLHELQKVLDHESIETTMIYAQFAQYHLIDVLKYNPLAYKNKAKAYDQDTVEFGISRHNTGPEFWPFPTC